MKRVVVTEDIHPDGMAILESNSTLQVDKLADCGAASLKAALADAHAVLVRSAQLSADVLADTPALEVVSRHGVGCDNVDVDALSRRNIPVAIAATANSTSVAEHVLMMMMVLTKQPFAYDAAAREGRYHERGKLPTSELQDKTILVIGYGRIGTKVAPICKAFGMHVIVADIALNTSLASQQGVQGVDDFRPWLPKADFVTLHVPLNNDTRHLIGEAELAAMPGHAIVINCARGGIVDELALARATRDGKIGGSGADVFSTEPPEPDNPLLDLPNSILSPHSAAVTKEGARRMATEAAQNIVDHFAGSLEAASIFNAADLTNKR